MAAQTLKVRIITPKEVVFDDQALAISSINSLGKFDILPSHANFISLIQNTPIVITMPDEKVITFKFPLAIIYTASNKVSIYTDIQLPQV